MQLWLWWLQPEHRVTWIGTILASLLLAWQTFLPAYYFYFVGKMKRPNPVIAIPTEWRVAMVVTKAPSEPWLVVQSTLRACLKQSHLHDTWLADEDPQPETIAWCQQQGVQLSCRKGIAAYHRGTWPRRTQCKEGNLAYFYDHYGYDRYDIVVQLDADHVPEPSYVESMLRPFVDPKVGYVAAPSVCDANPQVSWVVNARAFVEAPMHGTLQAGHSDGWAPLCIGSHYAVRTVALQAIGGLGPELAEDHSTTMMMNAHGWRGVFAFDAEAHGDGPACFTDFLTQEFQWAYSLTTLLLSVTPHYLGGLKPHLKFQFLFAQLWYPVYSFSMLLGVLLPFAAFVWNIDWVKVSFAEYVVRSQLPLLICLLCVRWLATRGWLRPQNAKIISWETVLFQLARWPWVVVGVSYAVLSRMLHKELLFKVTPKGENRTKPLPVWTLLPYLTISIVSSVTVITLTQMGHRSGYSFLMLLNALFYTGVSFAIVWAHIHENAPTTALYLKSKAAVACSVICIVSAMGIKTLQVVKSGFAENITLPTFSTSAENDSNLK